MRADDVLDALDEIVGSWQPPKVWYVALCQTCDPLHPVPFKDDQAGRDAWVAEHVEATRHPVVAIDHDPDRALLRPPALIRHGRRSCCATPGGGWSMLCGADACQKWTTELKTCAEAIDAWRGHDCKWQPIERDD